MMFEGQSNRFEPTSMSCRIARRLLGDGSVARPTLPPTPPKLALQLSSHYVRLGC